MAIKKKFVHSFLGIDGTLSTNKDTKNLVLGGHPETDIRQNDVKMIFFALFIL